MRGHYKATPGWALALETLSELDALKSCGLTVWECLRMAVPVQDAFGALLRAPASGRRRLPAELLELTFPDMDSILSI